MRCYLPISLFVGFVFVSCAKLGIGDKPKLEQGPSPYGAGGIPPKMRRKLPGSAPTTPLVGGVGADGEVLGITPEEDIIFTNPDDPGDNVPELASVLASIPKRRGPWEESETIAKQRAAREGKPLLIWFTDSARSPMCKALSQELFTDPAFSKWAKEKLVRLQVDAFVRVNDRDLSLDEKITREIDTKNYVTRLKKRYKVSGQPTLILLNPSGEVIGRYRGYKRGEAQYYWGLIKQGEIASTKAYLSWREDLENKGYREWQDRRGRKVFAKLTGYSDGTLILIEPDGTRCRTHEKKLCKEDRKWIDAQKKLRGR
jgi:thioredoxin-related protein